MSPRNIGNSKIPERLGLFRSSSIGDGEGNPLSREWCNFASRTAALLMGFGRISRTGIRSRGLWSLQETPTGRQSPILAGEPLLNWIDPGDLTDSSTGSGCPACADALRPQING